MKPFLITLLLLLSTPAVSHAAVRFVDDSGSDVGDCTNSASPCATIQYAVDQTFLAPSAGGDSIEIAEGTYFENVAIGSSFLSTLTLNGAGTGLTTVDGGANGSVFTPVLTTGLTLTLSNLTILNGDAPQGGGIDARPDTGTLVLTNVVVEENFTQTQGGGIKVEAGNLTLNNVVIQGNEAGDTVTFEGLGAGLYAETSTVVINNSQFLNNTANQLTTNGGAPGEGGGIYSYASDLTVTDSTFDGNRTLGSVGAIGGGGAAFYIECAGTLDLTGSTLSNNISESEAGGIYVGNCAPSILTITNSTISGNQANSYGGGIFTNSADTINIINTTITNNEADVDGNGFGDGGGIVRLLLVAATGTQTNAYTLTNSIIAENLVNGSLNTDNPDCLGSDEFGATIISAGGNLIGTLGDDGAGGVGCEVALQSGDEAGSNAGLLDPVLGALAANGGPTLTHLPLAGSPAIDTALLAACPAVDQRGFPRPAFGGCDKGSVEVQPTPSPSPTPTATPVPPIFFPQLEGGGCSLGLGSNVVSQGFLGLWGTLLGTWIVRRLRKTRD